MSPRARTWLLLVLTALAVLLIAAGFTVAREEALNRCGSDPPGSNRPGSSRHVEFVLDPPGYVCVFSEDDQVLRRERVLGF